MCLQEYSGRRGVSTANLYNAAILILFKFHLRRGASALSVSMHNLSYENSDFSTDSSTTTTTTVSTSSSNKISSNGGHKKRPNIIMQVGFSLDCIFVTNMNTVLYVVCTMKKHVAVLLIVHL